MQVVLGVVACIVVICHLVAVVIFLLQLAEILTLGASILCGGEAVLNGALSLFVDGFESGVLLAWFCHTYQVEGVFCLREYVGAVVGKCLQEWARRVLCFFAQAVVEHAANHVFHISVNQISELSLVAVRHCIVLEADSHLVVLLLLVLVNHYYGL